MGEERPRRWYVFVHQIPPRPLYLRAKIRQRLARIGAVALKNAVYVLPAIGDTLEDFQWMAQEVVAGGGDAFIMLGEFVGRPSDDDLVGKFNDERNRDYALLRQEIAEVRRRGGDFVRANRRLEEISGVDFFGAAGRGAVLRLLREAGAELRSARSGKAEGQVSPRGLTPIKNKTWVTRRGIKIDRMGSAWLIRRFLDPRAKFRFIDPERYMPRRGELRFDMVGGEFTHEGDKCTFEVLAVRSGLSDPALASVAEIIHDVDLKDGKFSRPEARGIDQLVQGIAAPDRDDEARLEMGFALFDGLYESFRAGERGRERKPRARGKRRAR